MVEHQTNRPAISRLAVVIVSYNVCPLLRNCLRSLQTAAAATPNLAVDLHVVDNASADGSADMVARQFPAVHLLPLAANLGFTGGNNLVLHRLGLPVAKPDVDLPQLEPAPEALAPDAVLLLNPDTEVAPDALARMVDVLARNPRAGVVGAHLTYGDGQFQHGAFHFPTTAQLLIDFFPLAGIRGAHRLHNSRVNGRYPRARWDGKAPFPVDFVLGAAMLVRSDAIRQVGGLDDGYFMYCEEMDWCLRMADAGWAVLAAPQAHVTHYEGRSSRQTPWISFERLWSSRFRFYAKHADRYPPGHLQATRLLVRASLAVKAAQARRRFARGATDGIALEQELAAYRTVSAL
jgi:N-acetylglucosaminyl-diphospho-decaprenol L-rhamnosyltransferase